MSSSPYGGWKDDRQYGRELGPNRNHSYRELAKAMIVSISCALRLRNFHKSSSVCCHTQKALLEGDGALDWPYQACVIPYFQDRTPSYAVPVAEFAETLRRVSDGLVKPLVHTNIQSIWFRRLRKALVVCRIAEESEVTQAECCQLLVRRFKVSGRELCWSIVSFSHHYGIF